MDGVRLGQMSLRWDALYCATTGLLVFALSPVLASGLSLPTELVLLSGILVGVWAAFLWFAPRKVALRPLLWLVLVANVAAAVAVGVSVALLSSAALVILFLAIAIEVAAFAASQALALRRLA